MPHSPSLVIRLEISREGGSGRKKEEPGGEYAASATREEAPQFPTFAGTILVPSSHALPPLFLYPPFPSLELLHRLSSASHSKCLIDLSRQRMADSGKEDVGASLVSSPLRHRATRCSSCSLYEVVVSADLEKTLRRNDERKAVLCLHPRGRKRHRPPYINAFGLTTPRCFLRYANPYDAPWHHLCLGLSFVSWAVSFPCLLTH